MTPLSRYFHLSQQCKCHSVRLYRGFSAALNSQTIQPGKIKDAKKLPDRGKSQNENFRKNDDNGKPHIKVCIIGGGVTPLYTAVLLKQYQIIKSINLVDTKNSESTVAVTDTCHMENSPCINYYGRKDFKQALKEVNIIALMDETDVVANIMPRAQFQSVVNYVRHTTDHILRFCPDALVAVFVRPVTATLVMVSEILKCSGWWNPDRIIGSTAAYGGRIEEMTAAFLNLERASMSVPMAGGADMRTIVPLLSRAVPFNRFTNAQRNSLLQSFQLDNDGEATGSSFWGPSLSSGTAAAKLMVALASGLRGYDNIVTCAYVRSNVLPVCRFFTSELQLGPTGVKRNFGLPKISPAEILLIERAIPLVNEYIDMAVAAVRNEKIQAKT